MTMSNSSFHKECEWIDPSSWLESRIFKKECSQCQSGKEWWVETLGSVSAASGILVTDRPEPWNSPSRRGLSLPTTECLSTMGSVQAAQPVQHLSCPLWDAFSIHLSFPAEQGLCLPLLRVWKGISKWSRARLEQPCERFKWGAWHAAEPAEPKPLVYAPRVMALTSEVKPFSSKIRNPNQARRVSSMQHCTV